MLCSCSMLVSCSEHCFLMLNSWHVVIFTKSVTWYLLHFRHACLNLLLSELAVAQCSSFAKHLEWIHAMYFVAMLECSSLLFLMHLGGLVLLGASVRNSATWSKAACLFTSITSCYRSSLVSLSKTSLTRRAWFIGSEVASEKIFN